jgi:hypothetical protein
VAVLRAGLRSVRFGVGQVLPSLALGVVAALAVLHGGRSGAGVGPLAPTLGAPKLSAGPA